MKDEALKLLDALKVKYSDVIYATSPSLAAQFENDLAGIKQALAAQPAPVQVIPILNNPDKELRWGADGFWSLHYADTLIRFLDKYERNFVDSAIAAAQLTATAQPAPVPLTARELELIDGMIEVQLDHAKRCDSIANRTMAERQKGWDMERVALLQKLKEKNNG